MRNFWIRYSVNVWCILITKAEKQKQNNNLINSKLNFREKFHRYILSLLGINKQQCNYSLLASSIYCKEKLWNQRWNRSHKSWFYFGLAHDKLTEDNLKKKKNRYRSRRTTCSLKKCLNTPSDLFLNILKHFHSFLKSSSNYILGFFAILFS